MTSGEALDGRSTGNESGRLGRWPIQTEMRSSGSTRSLSRPTAARRACRRSPEPSPKVEQRVLVTVKEQSASGKTRGDPRADVAPSLMGAAMQAR